MKTITSRQNPVVRSFRDLADDPDPAGARLLLDGVHLVRDAVAAGLDIEIAGVSEARLERETEEGALATALAASNVEVVATSEAVLAAMSPVRTPSGIVAIARRRPVTASEICATSAPLLCIAIDVQDPGNVGALIRVAEAAGATGMFVTRSSANPFSWKALRGSMGSTLRLPVVSGLTVAQVQACLKTHGVRTIASVARGGTDPDRTAWTGGVALLVGGEGPGLSEDVVAACDDRVTIPMAPHVESLNVAMAAAILLYAARRQRQPG